MQRPNEDIFNYIYMKTFKVSTYIYIFILYIHGQMPFLQDEYIIIFMTVNNCVNFKALNLNMLQG